MTRFFSHCKYALLFPEPQNSLKKPPFEDRHSHVAPFLSQVKTDFQGSLNSNRCCWELVSKAGFVGVLLHAARAALFEKRHGPGQPEAWRAIPYSGFYSPFMPHEPLKLESLVYI